MDGETLATCGAERLRRRRTGTIVLWLLAAATASVMALRISGHWPAGVTASRTAEQTIEAFHDALRSGNAALALSMLSPDATVFELGRVDASRRDYAAVHLSNDMKMAASARRELLGRRAGDSSAASRWVTSTYRWIEKTGAAESPPATLAETVVLRRTGDNWQIIHLHWSIDGTGPATR